MAKETLVITAVHGNEAFSIPVVEKLSSQFDFEWIIANPEALQQNCRFLESDLNRSGPGNPNSPLLEERLAFRLIQKGQEYQQVIDIHGTVADTGVFLILGDANWQNIELAKKFDVENVVLWPGLVDTGPLCQFIPRSLEIECGPKNSPDVFRELERVLTAFLAETTPAKTQQFFIVTGKLTGVESSQLKDFEQTTLDNNTFYPLLAGQYPDTSCYMMQKLNNDMIIA